MEQQPINEASAIGVDKKRYRGIYLLPNLFTTAGLFAGFYAVVAAMKGRFEVACVAVFIAMIADGLDGRVARLTNTQSAFGAQYDSLSDMVAFGLAPALVAYSWALVDLGKFGWLAAFCFAATTALRLARFNVQLSIANKRYFQGLPSPAAAAIITSFIWIGAEFAMSGEALAVFIAILTLAVSVLMVSNIRFYSFKEIDFKGKVPFSAILVVILIFVGISLDPPIVLFVAFIAYGLSGPTILLMRRLRRLRLRQKNIVPPA